jgi:DNA-binding transcriptional LysR family regulator
VTGAEPVWIDVVLWLVPPVEIYQLRTFVAVAREGSITRASEQLHLSQPAVSAHIKAIEDSLGLTLFERTPRGMSLTSDGERLLVKAEQTLGVHQELMEEAKRIKGQLTGRLRLGACGSSIKEAVGHLVTVLSERCPEVEVAVKHGTSQEILTGLRNGTLDAGYYNEAGESEPELTTVEVSRFGICLAAAPKLVEISQPLDWNALADLPWIYPTASTCCGKTAELLFKTHEIRPRKIISIDREQVTRTLVAGGVGIGLLHADTANEARALGEVQLLFESPSSVRVLFAHLASRAQDPLVSAASSIVRMMPAS